MVDIQILNYNDAQTTIDCAKRCSKLSIVDKILIVDNFSTDSSFEDLSAIADEKIIVIRTDKNGGYGYGNNFGIRYLHENFKSKYILLCNPDTIVEEDAVIACRDFLEDHKNFVFCAPIMLNANKEVQFNTYLDVPSKWKYIFSSELVFSKLFSRKNQKKLSSNMNREFIDVDMVSGALFLMNTQLMMQHGMYDENVFLYSEEIILSLKFKKQNLRCAILPRYPFIHNHSVSVNKAFKPIKRKKILQKSRFYVMKKYLNCGVISLSIAHVLSFIDLLETWLMYKLFKKI